MERREHRSCLFSGRRPLALPGPRHSIPSLEALGAVGLDLVALPTPAPASLDLVPWSGDRHDGAPGVDPAAAGAGMERTGLVPATHHPDTAAGMAGTA